MNLPYGSFNYIDNVGTNNIIYTYSVKYKNACGFSSETEGANASDEVDSEPCPAIGNTLIITKSGENAVLNWQATECNDFDFYYVYATSS